MDAQTNNPGTWAGAETALVGTKQDRRSEFALQAQALEAKLSLQPHMARCVLLLLRGDVW